MVSAKSSVVPLTVLILAHIGLSLGYVLVLPPLNWPDEPAHLSYITRLARGEGLDRMRPGSWSSELLAPMIDDHFAGVTDPLGDPRLEGVRYQAHQPPVHYVLAAAVLATTGSLLAVRLLNLAISCLGLVMAHRLALQLGLGSWAALVAVGFLAFLPSRCYFAVSVGNDPATELVFTAFFMVLTRPWNGSPAASGRRILTLGLIVGVGLLVKTTALLLLPLQALWLALCGSKARGWMATLLTGAVAFAIASPWLVRNVGLYGASDPLALRAGALGSGEELPPDPSTERAARPVLEGTGEHGLAAFTRSLFLSFWGVFGWMEMWPGPGLSALYVLLTVLAAAGLVRAWPSETKTVSWSLLCVATVGFAVLLYALFDYQPQGRYLLVVSAPLAVLFALGWTRVSARSQGVGLLCLFALAAANLYGLRYMIPWYLG